MSDAQGSALTEAMNRLWTKYLPQMEERVLTLQNAAAQLTGGLLSRDQQEHAGEEAHKLAGVLGTFGLTEGTELAREAESLYGGALDRDSGIAARLTAIADELKAMVTSRGSGT